MALLDLFQAGDVYLDYPFEELKFRFVKEGGKVFCRFYGKPEVEIDHTDEHFREAMSAGKVITPDEYFGD